MTLSYKFVRMNEINFLIKNYLDSVKDMALAGKAVSDDAKPIIERGDIIIFDMTGQQSVSTVFLNASFGFLIDEYGLEKIKKSFRFHNILRSQAERIKKYFDDYQISIMTSR